MSQFQEKFTAFFFATLLLGCGYLIYKSTDDRADCTKVAMSQNRPVEEIKLLCR